MSNVLTFPAPTRTTTTVQPRKAPLKFTIGERNALIAGAYAMPGNVESVFDVDDDGDEGCAMMPGEGGEALFTVDAGDVLALRRVAGIDTLATSPDVEVIVAAMHRVTGHRVG